MTFGITAMMLPQLRDDKTINYNPSHESWIASISALSMVFGSLSSGQILDLYGRKIAHVILGVPFFIGWVAIACARSTSLMIVGRFFTGLSSGANIAVMLVYIGELASPKIRSFALIFPSILLNVGIILSHIIAYYTNWKICSFICIFTAVMISVTSLFLKESPLWLISKGRTEEGIVIFRWFRGMDDASEAELKTILERQSEQPKTSAKETFKVVCSSTFIKPMLTLLVVMVNMQFCGVGVISYYAFDIFRETFAGNIDPMIIMAVTDCVVGIMSVGICILGKYFSKKNIYLISSFGVSLFIAGLVACLVAGFGRYIWLPETCLVLFFCFSTGLYTIGWAFIPELLPHCARGLGSGLNSAFASISLFSIVKVTPGFIKTYTPAAAYGFFGVSTFICGTILCFTLPETDGKTLQSIEDSYNKDKTGTAPL